MNLLLPKIVLLGMLFWALSPANPYGYYILLRWVACPILAASAYLRFKRGDQHLGWGLGLLAFVYNPVIRVHLTRGFWEMINVLTIGAIILDLYSLRMSPNHRIQPPAAGEENSNSRGG